MAQVSLAEILQKNFRDSCVNRRAGRFDETQSLRQLYEEANPCNSNVSPYNRAIEAAKVYNVSLGKGYSERSHLLEDV